MITYGIIGHGLVFPIQFQLPVVSNGPIATSKIADGKGTEGSGKSVEL